MNARRTIRPSRVAHATRWSVLFSSKRQDWATPDHLFRELNDEFHFTVDASATAENTKCPRYFSPEQDGLLQDWGQERIWCNPPYNAVADWLAKAHNSSRAGALCVLLIPSRTDTKAWHEHAMHASEIRFVRGRLRFGNAKHTAPFPSALVIFRPPIIEPVQLQLWDESDGEHR